MDTRITTSNCGPKPILKLPSRGYPTDESAEIQKIVLLGRLIILQHALAVEHTDKSRFMENTPKEHFERHNLHIKQAKKLGLPLKLDKPLTDLEWHYLVNGACLQRYLTSQEGRLMDAYNSLLDTIIWKREQRPLRISPEQARGSIGDKTLVYRRGFGRYGNPIIYVKPRCGFNGENIDQLSRLLIYTIERALLSVEDTRTSGFIFLVDYDGVLSTETSHFTAAKDLVTIFNTHYPESLFRAFIIGDHPWYFQALLSMITPFVAERTAKKFALIDKTVEADIAIVHDAVGAENLEDWIPNGELPTLNSLEDYWKEEDIQSKEFMDFLKSALGQKPKQVLSSIKDSQQGCDLSHAEIKDSDLNIDETVMNWQNKTILTNDPVDDCKLPAVSASN